MAKSVDFIKYKVQLIAIEKSGDKLINMKKVGATRGTYNYHNSTGPTLEAENRRETQSPRPWPPLSFHVASSFNILLVPEDPHVSVNSHVGFTLQGGYIRQNKMSSCTLTASSRTCYILHSSLSLINY